MKTLTWFLANRWLRDFFVPKPKLDLHFDKRRINFLENFWLGIWGQFNNFDFRNYLTLFSNWNNLDSCSFLSNFEKGFLYFLQRFVNLDSMPNKNALSPLLKYVLAWAYYSNVSNKRPYGRLWIWSKFHVKFVQKSTKNLTEKQKVLICHHKSYTRL